MSSLWSTLEGGVVGAGVGIAVAEVAKPVLEVTRQEAWSENPYAVLDVGTLARLVAQGRVSFDQAAEQAKRNGFDSNKFAAVCQVALQAAPVAELLELWRRDKISPDLVKHGLAKAQIEPQYWEPIMELFNSPLDPAVVATAVQRSLLPNEGILPVVPPITGGRVPPMPQVDLNPFTEAQWSGVSADRLKVLARIVGLPASPDLAARMVFREIIDPTDFDRAIAEGNTRNEWAPFLFDGFRQIPTAHDGVELRLRGWTNDAGMYKQTARHGMSPEDTDLLFKITGRPISFRQVFIGERRGGTFDGPQNVIDPHFLKSLQESNIRPEWYNLAWAQRHSYPSAFVVRALLQGGALNETEGKDIFLAIGWPDALATKVAAHYAVTTGPVADPNVKKAETQLWTTTHRSYIATESGDAEARARFDLLGIPGAAQSRILQLWASERGLIRAQLSPADIRKAYQQGDVNAATGTAWTHDDAIAAFLDRGWSMTDAESYLVIPYKG